MYFIHHITTSREQDLSIIHPSFTTPPPHHPRLPSGQYSVLCPEAMDGAVLHAQSYHTSALSILHEQVQRKVLDKVLGVMTKRLQHTEIELYTCIHTYVHTYVHTQVYTYIIHTYTHTYIHTYIHTYTHTYIHTWIYTYTHTHT